MCVASRPSFTAAWTITIAAVCAPSPPAPANLRPSSSPPNGVSGNPDPKDRAAGSRASMASRTVAGLNDGDFHAPQLAVAATSFFTPSGNTGTICSFTQRSASSGERRRCVGHSASTSTNENPLFSAWSWSAFFTAFAARTRCFASKSATRSTYTGPSSCATSSAILSGWPMLGSRPCGEVVVFWPMSVVGAIWPPVMP